MAIDGIDGKNRNKNKNIDYNNKDSIDSKHGTRWDKISMDPPRSRRGVKERRREKKNLGEKPSLYTQGAKRVDLMSTLTKHLSARLHSLFRFFAQRTSQLLTNLNLG